MGAGIPQINPVVGVQDVPPRYARGAPQIPDPMSRNLEIAGRGIAEVGNSIGGILAVQQRHQQILDADAAEENFKASMAQTLVNAKQLPGAAWAPTVASQSADLIQKTLEDPANSHIAPYLKARLPAIAGMFHTQALESGAAQTAKEQDDQYNVVTGNLAAQVGDNYQVNPDGTIGDGPAAQAARAKNDGFAKAMWGQNPNMLAVKQQQFDDKAVMQRAQAIARNPDAAHPDLLNTYLNQNAGKFDPQQESQLKSSFDQAVREPIRQAETAHGLAQVGLKQQLDQMSAAHDPNLVSKAAQAVQDGFLSQEDYRNYAHAKYYDPSAPGVKEFWQNKITDDPFSVSAADISAIDPNTLNGPDRNSLVAWRVDTLNAAKKPLKAAYDKAQQDIRDMFPRGYMPEDFTHRTENMARALGDMKTAYDAGEFEKPTEMQKYVDQIRDRYAPKSKPIAHVPLPSTITRDQALKAAERAKSVGFDPSASAGGL